MIMKNPSKLAKEFMENGKLLSTPVIDAHTHMGPDSGADMPFSSAESMIVLLTAHCMIPAVKTVSLKK